MYQHLITKIQRRMLVHHVYTTCTPTEQHDDHYHHSREVQYYDHHSYDHAPHIPATAALANPQHHPASSSVMSQDTTALAAAAGVAAHELPADATAARFAPDETFTFPEVVPQGGAAQSLPPTSNRQSAARSHGVEEMCSRRLSIYC